MVTFRRRLADVVARKKVKGSGAHVGAYALMRRRRKSLKTDEGERKSDSASAFFQTLFNVEVRS